MEIMSGDAARLAGIQFMETGSVYDFAQDPGYVLARFILSWANLPFQRLHRYS